MDRKYTVRLETKADYPVTENITREAFWNVYSPACCEHYLLHVMRDAEAFLPSLALVAEEGDTVVGCIYFMRAILHCDNGTVRTVLTMGPIAVLPQYQRCGIGRMLIEHAKRIARREGYEAMLLCGDPAYYSKSGFVPAERFGVRTADDMYADALQAFELREGALAGAAGRYAEDAVYDVDMDAVREFDKAFPPKTAEEGTPSQMRFAEIAAMRRAAR